MLKINFSLKLTTVGMLTFMSMIKSMLCLVEHETRLINLELRHPRYPGRDPFHGSRHGSRLGYRGWDPG